MRGLAEPQACSMAHACASKAIFELLPLHQSSGGTFWGDSSLWAWPWCCIESCLPALEACLVHLDRTPGDETTPPALGGGGGGTHLAARGGLVLLGQHSSGDANTHKTHFLLFSATDCAHPAEDKAPSRTWETISPLGGICNTTRKKAVGGNSLGKGTRHTRLSPRTKSRWSSWILRNRKNMGLPRQLCLSFFGH